MLRSISNQVWSYCFQCHHQIIPIVFDIKYCLPWLTISDYLSYIIYTSLSFSSCFFLLLFLSCQINVALNFNQLINLFVYSFLTKLCNFSNKVRIIFVSQRKIFMKKHRKILFTFYFWWILRIIFKHYFINSNYKTFY